MLREGEMAVIESGVWHDWWMGAPAVRAHDRNLLRSRATWAHRPARHAESAATRAECAGVQRQVGIGFEMPSIVLSVFKKSETKTKKVAVAA